MFNPDPHLYLKKGAPNKLQAKRFIEFILSEEAQKILFLPLGSPQGPKYSSLGRMAINKSSYKQKLKQVSQLNLYDLNFSPFKLNSQKASKIQFVLWQT